VVLPALTVAEPFLTPAAPAGDEAFFFTDDTDPFLTDAARVLGA
jgi:hypothetical protein